MPSPITDRRFDHRLPVTDSRWPRPRPRAALGLFLILLALACVADANVIFRGQTLVASANYHPFDDRGTAQRPGDLASPAFLNWHDQGTTWWQWEPAARFFSSAFRAGHVPLWDPRIGGGVDAHTQLMPTQYYPPYAALLAAGNQITLRDAYYLGEILLAGFCSLLLVRRQGFSAAASLAFGVCVMLGGTMTQTINSPQGQSFAVLPVVVLAADWLADAPSSRRAAIAALVFACAMLSSFLPIVFSAFVLVALLLAARICVRAAPDQPPPSVVSRVPRIAWSIASLALGALLAAFLLWPFHLMQTQDPAFAAWYRDKGLLHYAWDRGLSLISPRIGYDVLQTPDARAQLFPPPDQSISYFFYVGLVPLLLATLARQGRTAATRRFFWCFLAATILLFLKAFGVPPVQWLGALPVLSQLHIVPYFNGALAFAIAGLAACGVEALVTGDASFADVWRVTGGAALVAGLVVWFVETHAVNTSTTPALLAAAEHRMAIASGELAALAAALVALVFWRRAGLAPGRFGAMAVVLIVVELVPLHARARYERADVWRSPPAYVQALQADPSLFRVHSTFDLALTPDVPDGLGLTSLGSRATFNPPRYTTLLRTYFAAPPLPFPLPAVLVPDARRVLDVLNVKYLVAYAPTPAQLDDLSRNGFDVSTTDGRFVVLVNETVWPRAYLTRRFSLASSPEAALDAVASLDPGSVVLEDRPASVTADSAAAGAIDAIRYGDDDVQIDVTVDHPAILVLADSGAPGWRAFVNGRETPILRANYAFRAVEVSGRATVEFRYRTPGLAAGLTASTTGLIVVAGLLAAGRRRRGV
jgi:hypothetical protein